MSQVFDYILVYSNLQGLIDRHQTMPTNINIVHLLLKGCIHIYVFLSNLLTMAGPDEDFSSLISSEVRSSVPLFVNSFFQFARVSRHPQFALQSRFLVSGVGIRKALTSVQHESLAIWTTDTLTDKKYEFVIDRQPSSHSRGARFSNFMNFFPSAEVIESISSVVSNMLSRGSQTTGVFLPSTSTETPFVFDTEVIPLIPMTAIPDALDSLQTTAQPFPSTFSLDRITSSLARALAAARGSSNSVSPPSLAEDMISGRPVNSLVRGESIRYFEPVGLSLFDVALLAKVIHDFAPMYGLFDNQCYMYASVMFDTIVQLYSFSSAASSLPPEHSVPSTSRPRPVPAPTPEVDAPENANILIMPDHSGRWWELLILDPRVKSTVVRIVIDRFNEEKALFKCW